MPRMVTWRNNQVLVQYLLTEGVTKEKEGGQEALFDDPRVLGSRRVSEGRI